MFEEYLQDAAALFSTGSKASNQREARKYYRAAIFYAFSALEAFINQIADPLYDSKNITKEQHYFLLDKKQEFSTKSFKLTIKSEYHRVDEKIKLVVKKYSSDFDFNNVDWAHLMELKETRDSLIHPKNSEDQLETSDYLKIIKNGLNGVISTINSMNQFVYGKPLRVKILELKLD